MNWLLASVLVFQAGWFSHRWYAKSRITGRTMRDVISARRKRRHDEPPNVTEVA